MSKEITNPIQEVWCYVTDEEEAFFIMERLHSGEDRGRGVKAWSSREKDVFQVRRSDKKTLSYLIDFYVKKHCDNFDITSLMPFTTIKRIFGNKKIKSEIGLDINDESTFTESRMKLIVTVSKHIVERAKKEGLSLTRLYNLASEIEEMVQPLVISCKNGTVEEIQEKNSIINDESLKTQINAMNNIVDGFGISNQEKDGQKTAKTENITSSDRKNDNSQRVCIGTKKNLPYFFLGIDFSHLSPADVDTHGIAEVCSELKYFSERQLVDKLPIAAVYLIRSVIEQAIIYYSKKHCIQGQNKLIWENIKNMSKLSKIIANYNKNLPNYIIDTEIRQYFTALFEDYEKHVDPLNWVVHRPAEFQLDTKTLVELPQRGLLTLINYFIAE